ncbi:hypothetical protein K438DRAFT_1932127 [Mycena galopus ATCC 62051]|nr:hypothetical protein K438DRAFT_1932127 [Mycena galopus ATCC 62051]
MTTDMVECAAKIKMPRLEGASSENMVSHASMDNHGVINDGQGREHRIRAVVLRISCAGLEPDMEYVGGRISRPNITCVSSPETAPDFLIVRSPFGAPDTARVGGPDTVTPRVGAPDTVTPPCWCT